LAVSINLFKFAHRNKEIEMKTILVNTYWWWRRYNSDSRKGAVLVYTY